MTYEQFINELKSLLSRAKELFNAHELELNQDFKRWKKELSALLIAIEEKGYDVQCNVISRDFTLFIGYGSIPSDSQLAKEFNSDLQDTINEIEIIIDHYNKFGDPRGKIETQSQSTQELKYPDKVSLAWLWNHMPIKLCVSGIIILFSVFLLGIGFGQTELYKGLTSDSTELLQEGSNEQEPNKPLNSTPKSGAN